jgi:phosphoribosylformylglycinamidine cyclo-ligase
LDLGFGSWDFLVPRPLTYKASGVDTAAKDAFIDRLLARMRRTHGRGVVDLPWGFAGLHRIPGDPDRLLAASTDGVGTKLKVAFLTGRHDTVGIDLVAMSVNDLIVCGARPLFFLDYIATGRVDVPTLEAATAGIVAGCRQAGCALLGGETAEMPGFYADGEYDMAGFAVGTVERRRLIDGRRVAAGDAVIGIASSGLHANGYSLARRILFDRMGLDVRSRVRGLAKPVGETLLMPTRIYAKPVAALLARLGPAVRALANVTGGGMVENIPRVIPAGRAVEIREGTWPVPSVFTLLQRGGAVARDEMYRVFNMGVGMAAIVRAADAERACRALRKAGERAWVIGKVVRGNREVRIAPEQ